MATPNPNLSRSYVSHPLTSHHLPNLPTLPNLSLPIQHHQYPGINSIPGMHPVNNLPLHSSMHNSMHNPMHNLHSFPPPLHSFQPMPAIPAMQSLIHPDNIHHTATTALSGRIDKRRKPTRPSSLPYSAILSPDDTNMILAAQQATAHVSHHPAPTVYQCDGIQFKVLDQLPDTKIQRLRTEKIKPIEHLTFSDIKAYNRNQLRAYCSVYGIRRKKKAEMERDMARYAALFHQGDPLYDWQKFEPTEYADGPIPRRKVPVTKEQKEQAAGDFKRLTHALQQRPHIIAPHITTTPHPHSHYPLASPPSSSHHFSVSHGYLNARLPDIHQTHSLHPHVPDDHPDHVVSSDLMSVPEMHVPNHLLGISHHQLPDE